MDYRLDGLFLKNLRSPLCGTEMVLWMYIESALICTICGSQGFAPHWDDIEAFILQTEGAKHWQVGGISS
jgi:hypothetical protein